MFRVLNPMSCGIHTGIYLSLLKYVAFINSLLVHLYESGICCAVQGFKVSPLGHADDIASASTSKHNVDRTLDTVLRHSKRWRYKFNASYSFSAKALQNLKETVNTKNIDSVGRRLMKRPPWVEITLTASG